MQRLGADCGDYKAGKSMSHETSLAGTSRGSKGTLLRHVRGTRKVRVIHSLGRQNLALPRKDVAWPEICSRIAESIVLFRCFFGRAKSVLARTKLSAYDC